MDYFDQGIKRSVTWKLGGYLLSIFHGLPYVLVLTSLKYAVPLTVHKVVCAIKVLFRTLNIVLIWVA